MAAGGLSDNVGVLEVMPIQGKSGPRLEAGAHVEAATAQGIGRLKRTEHSRLAVLVAWATF